MKPILSTLLILVILQVNTSSLQERLLSNALYVKRNNIEMPMMAKSNITQLATMVGEKFDQHEVITEDGYILTIFRLYGASGGPPVLLQHGMGDAADSYFLRGNTSIPVVLKNAGYDVWIGNERGNRYSKKHIKLNPYTHKQFWDYSYHEYGYYDYAAMIDFVLQKTKMEKVALIGHSQGHTAAYVLASTRPEYNEKISIIVALAPIAFVDHIKPPVSYLMELGYYIDMFLKMTGQEEVLADHNLIKILLRMACLSNMNYQVCAQGLYMALSGQDPEEFEPEFMSVVAGHFPDVTSRKSINHYIQSWTRKRFSFFDYGKERNLELYKSVEPPDYDLSKVTAKVAIFYGTNDNFAHIADVKRLKSNLPNVVRYSAMPKICSHLDFIWGRNLHQYLAAKIVRLLNKHVK